MVYKEVKYNRNYCDNKTTKQDNQTAHKMFDCNCCDPKATESYFSYKLTKYKSKKLTIFISNSAQIQRLQNVC